MNQMSEDRKLLQKLEDCITRAGSEFQKKGDDYFWAEGDLVHVLLTYLWNESELVHKFKHPMGDGVVPLAHTEHLKIDLYLCDPATAVKLVRDCANDPDCFREAGILASVEIKYLGPPQSWKKFYPTIDRLLKQEQVENAYLVVFAQVQILRKGHIIDRRDWYQTQVELLKHKWEELGGEKTLTVYCIPSGTMPILKNFSPL